MTDKKTGCKCRYDAWGKKILPHADMILYYKDDVDSLDIVRRFMPHRHVCIPTVEILIDCKNPEMVDVYLIYPGETILLTKDMSVRAVEGLRRTYRGKKGWTVKDQKNGVVNLRREGRVILDPCRKYGIYR